MIAAGFESLTANMHNHMTRDIKDPGLCPACDEMRTRMDTEERIQKALNYAYRYGTTDGDHHKMWVIDQMVRALLGVPVEPRTVETQYGDFTYETQGTNDEYGKFTGDDWDIGVPP